MPWQVTRRVDTKDGSDYVTNDKLMIFTSYAETAEAAKQEAAGPMNTPAFMLEASFYQEGARVAEDPEGNILEPLTKEEVGRMLGLGRPATQQEYDAVLNAQDGGIIDAGGPGPVSSGKWW